MIYRSCWGIRSQLRSKLFPLEAGPALPVKPNFVPNFTPLRRGKTGPMLDMCAKDLCRLPLPVALWSIQLCFPLCANNLCYQCNYLGETILLILKISCLGLMEGDLFLVFRDGRANSNSRSDTQGSAERAERRGDTAGDGAIPLCVFGQGLTRLLFFFSYWVEQCIDRCNGPLKKKLRQKITKKSRPLVVMLGVTALF